MHRVAARLAAVFVISIVATANLACAREGAAPIGDAAPAAATVEAENNAITRGVDEIITREMEAIPMAGVSAAIARGDEVLVAKGYGLADIENSVPATDETVYRIGSITKQFTAAGIMQLVESGDVSLDDELTRFLPDYPTQGHVVTIEHLLNHTSGIKSYTGLGQRWRRTVPLDLSRDELVEMFKDEPFDFAPGERYRYNNSGYYLLGLIIEKASGQTYTEYLEEHVFPKAGLDATYYCDNRPIIPNRAEGYQIVDGEIVNDDLIGMRQPFAAGSLCSTVTDLVKWTRALSSGAVVSPDSYVQMTTPRLALGLPATEYLDLELTADDLATYAGTYGRGDIRVAVAVRDGRLFLEGTGMQTRLMYQGDHAFVEDLDPHIGVRFIVDGETATAIVVSPGGRLPRIPEEQE
jgi:CubicO group peptidase (beta-lactamase class C family)